MATGIIPLNIKENALQSVLVNPNTSYTASMAGGVYIVVVKVIVSGGPYGVYIVTHSIGANIHAKDVLKESAGVPSLTIGDSYMSLTAGANSVELSWVDLSAFRPI